jgi:hypothetical protein
MQSVLRHFKIKTVKKNNIFTLFILAIINISCVSEKRMFGLYGKCPKGYFGCSQFLLNSDGSFEHYIFMDVGGTNFIKGKWTKINTNEFLLNTYSQPIVPKTYYKSSINNNLENKIKIRVIEQNFPIPGFIVKLNSEYGITDYDGEVTFDKQNIDKIKLLFLSFDEEIEIIKNDKESNYFTIYIRDLNSSVIPDYYTDKLIKFKNKKIYIETDYSLKKTNINNKQW